MIIQAQLVFERLILCVYCYALTMPWGRLLVVTFMMVTLFNNVLVCGNGLTVLTNTDE